MEKHKQIQPPVISTTGKYTFKTIEQVQTEQAQQQQSQQYTYENYKFGKQVWENQRKQWMNKNQSKQSLPQNYSFQDQITVFDRPYIEEIINAIKGPYQPFKKYINLKDLTEVLEEIWDQSD